MRRLSAILLLFTFLIANSGMAVTMHFCGGEITSIDFFSTEKKACECGDKLMKSSCCKDKTAVFKTKIDNEKVGQFILKSSTSKYNFKSFNELVIAPLVQPRFYVLDLSLSYQFKPKVPIYLLDRVFLI